MHPLISCWLRAEEIYACMTFKSRDRLQQLNEIGEFESELVASCQSPKLLVGFLTTQYRHRPVIAFWDNTSLFTGDSI